MASFFTRIALAKIRAEAAAAQPFASADADEISIRMQPFLDLQLACETNYLKKKDEVDTALTHNAKQTGTIYLVFILPRYRS